MSFRLVYHPRIAKDKVLLNEKDLLTLTVTSVDLLTLSLTSAELAPSQL
jgi:hypothetical protein